MLEQEPSRTALAAAAHRGAHQLLEGGRVFADPLAVSILGPEGERIARGMGGRPGTAGMRLFIAARSRLTEDRLAEGVASRGVRQLVVLGAGLDTYAYRGADAGRLRMFEVDHPATQAWKRRRLAEADIAVPAGLVFAPVDFERERLADALATASVDSAERTFFTWLGVVPYLTRDAVEATLRLVGGWPGGGEVAFDYADPPHTLSPEHRAAHAERAERVATLGEPFLSDFEPADMRELLRSAGFREVDDLAPPAWVERTLGSQAHAAMRARGGGERGGHVVWAAS